MLNLDMIGWDNPQGNYIEIETLEKWSGLAQIFASAAQKFCSIPYVISFHAWGSDHMPYLNHGIPALLTTNKDCVDYPSYHTSSDTIDKVSVKVSQNFLKMDIAALAQFFFNDINPALGYY